MIRILHLADVHLGATCSAFGNLAEKRRKSVLEAFRRLPDAAEREGAAALVVAGDLFDGPRPEPEVVAAARETFRRLGDAGRPVFLIPGNHDATTLLPNPYRDPFPGVRLLDAPSFGEPVSVDTPGGPLHAYGVAYDRARDPDPVAGFRRADLAGLHVVLLHGPVPDAPHWSTSGNALRLEPDALRGLDADYIALGDYHRFRPPEGFDAGGALPACYPGSFAAVDLTETGPRGWVVADLAPGEAPAVRHVPSGVRPVVDAGEVDVSGFGSSAEVADAIAVRVPAEAIPVARLVGIPGFPLDADAVRAHLTERFGHAGVTDASRYFASERLEELARQETVVGHVVRLGLRRIQEEPDGDPERAVAERALRYALASLEVE